MIHFKFVGIKDMHNIYYLGLSGEHRCPLGYLFSHVGTELPLPGYYQYFRGVKCFAQGHNTAEVGFEPPTSRSGVHRSTTEPPGSQFLKGRLNSNRVA